MLDERNIVSGSI